MMTTARTADGLGSSSVMLLTDRSFLKAERAPYDGSLPAARWPHRRQPILRGTDSHAAATRRGNPWASPGAVIEPATAYCAGATRRKERRSTSAAPQPGPTT